MNAQYKVNESKLGKKAVVERVLDLLNDEKSLEVLKQDDLKFFIEDCFPVVDSFDIKPVYKLDSNSKSRDYGEAVKAITDWGDAWQAMDVLRKELTKRLDEDDYTETDWQRDYNYFTQMPGRLANYVLYHNATTGWLAGFLSKHSEASLTNRKPVITADNLQDIKNNLVRELKKLA